ncbi:transcriptional regulator [Frankia sp. R43]|nr:transcriptional regulator [Frankia sp. R43]MBE3204762.1 transcriptional regulator [Parafrankia sp. CH37]
MEYSGLAHAVRILGKLWELDFLCKHNNIQRMFFAVTFDSASREALVMPPDLDLSGHGHRKVSTADVELLKHHTHLYGKLDALHGSGKFRSVFAGFMDAHTTELLHGSFSTQLGRKLYGSVADAVLTMASMAYDDQLPGLAQRYDLQAMRLAQAIGDRSRITRAHIHHARLAAAHGERKCALTHARSAVLASAGAPPLVKAYAAVTEARAWAFNGQPSQTSAAVARARDALNRAGSTDPGWLSWLDRSELERQAAWALAVAGLSVPGMDALHEALNVPSDHRRANVELLITAAELARLRGDLAEHASLAKRAEDASRPLMSRRLAARVKLLVSGQPLDDF